MVLQDHFLTTKVELSVKKKHQNNNNQIQASGEFTWNRKPYSIFWASTTIFQ